MNSASVRPYQSKGNGSVLEMPRARRERVVPQSLEGEQSILGSMIIDTEAIAVAIELLSGHEFYREMHRKLYEVIVELFNEGTPVDLITVVLALQSKNLLEEVGGAAYLTALIQSVGSTTNIKAYIRPVEVAADAREVIHLCDAAQAKLLESPGNVYNVIAELEQSFLDLASKREQNNFQTAAQVLGKLVDKFDERQQGVTPGIPTGFRDYDELTGGLQPTELTIWAGRPGMGKTASLMNVVDHVSRVEQKPVAVFSLEMGADSLMERLVSGEARVDGQKLRSGKCSTHEWEDVAAAVERLWDAKIFINDATDMTALQMRAKVRALAAAQGQLGLIVVDYLQIVDDSGHKGSREQAIAEITRTMGKIAKEQNCPVLALAQLSRKCEEREDKRPMLSDLRESGSIEQEAQVVAFWYRPAYYRRKEAERDGIAPPEIGDEHIAELIVAKQRNGNLGTVQLAFFGEYTRFENLAPEPAVGYAPQNYEYSEQAYQGDTFQAGMEYPQQFGTYQGGGY